MSLIAPWPSRVGWQILDFVPVSSEKGLSVPFKIGRMPCDYLLHRARQAEIPHPGLALPMLVLIVPVVVVRLAEAVPVESRAYIDGMNILVIH
jgi:hypothetical protein